MRPIFKNRREAGKALAARLQKYKGQHPLILALPRGGVPVAYEVAMALEAPLDILIVRKLGLPGQEELAIGAIGPGGMVLNESLVEHLGISSEVIERVRERE